MASRRIAGRNYEEISETKARADFVKGDSVLQAEFDAVPEDERIHFFMLTQTANEIAMLRSLMLQALNGISGRRAVRETSLGLAFMLARTLATRICDGWKLVNRDISDGFLETALGRLNDNILVTELRRDATEAKGRLQIYFTQPNPLIKRVRDKLASHMDASAIRKAYDLLTPEMALTDFHTGVRGTTFYGVSDTLAAVATSGLADRTDPADGQRLLMDQASQVGGDLETVIDAFALAFFVGHFGAEKFAIAPTIIDDLPGAHRAKVRFYMDSSVVKARLSRVGTD